MKEHCQEKTENTKAQVEKEEIKSEEMKEDTKNTAVEVEKKESKSDEMKEDTKEKTKNTTAEVENKETQSVIMEEDSVEKTEGTTAEVEKKELKDGCEENIENTTAEVEKEENAEEKTENTTAEVGKGETKSEEMKEDTEEKIENTIAEAEKKENKSEEMEEDIEDKTEDTTAEVEKETKIEEMEEEIEEKAENKIAKVEKKATDSEDMEEDIEQKTENKEDKFDGVKEEEKNLVEPIKEKGSRKRPRTKTSSAGKKDKITKNDPEEKVEEQKTQTDRKNKEPKKSVDKMEEPKTPVAFRIDRPVRERKSVERLVTIIEQDSAKEFHIGKSRGTALKDIPNVAYKLSRIKSDDTAKMLHTILFGRRGKAAEVMNNISKFSGFVWHDNEEKQTLKVREKLDKIVKEKLLEFCDVLDIPISKANSRKEDVIAKLVEFLVEPHTTTSELLAENKQTSKGNKRKRVSKSASGTGSDSPSKGSDKIRARSNSMRSKIKSGAVAGAGAGALSNPIHDPSSQFQLFFEGETLTSFLKSIRREIESARAVDTALPLKFWIKQQFAVGVNEVTRALERMPPNHGRAETPSSKSPCVYLQAILISDCNPRWLSKHLPALAASRNVPLIFLRDKKEGSLRLGKLVQLKTAIAIGIKDNGNGVNEVIKEVLVGDKIDSIEG